MKVKIKRKSGYKWQKAYRIRGRMALVIVNGKKAWRKIVKKARSGFRRRRIYY